MALTFGIFFVWSVLMFEKSYWIRQLFFCIKNANLLKLVIVGIYYSYIIFIKLVIVEDYVAHFPGIKKHISHVILY